MRYETTASCICGVDQTIHEAYDILNWRVGKDKKETLFHLAGLYMAYHCDPKKLMEYHEQFCRHYKYPKNKEEQQAASHNNFVCCGLNAMFMLGLIKKEKGEKVIAEIPA